MLNSLISLFKVEGIGVAGVLGISKLSRTLELTDGSFAELDEQEFLALMNCILENISFMPKLSSVERFSYDLLSIF